MLFDIVLGRNGGGEGSRTPVRKAVYTGRYMFSLSIDSYSAKRRKAGF